MNCKKRYKDKDKYREYAKRIKRNYREKTGAYLYEKRLWTNYEDELIMEHAMTDRELSVKIQRSVGAIQLRRWRLKKEEQLNENG